MYAIVKAFLERLGSDEADKIEYSATDSRIAMAVLLYRIMMVDGRVRDPELRRYRQLLQEKLKVAPTELAQFEAQVRLESNREPSLFPFTVIVNKLPLETRREILKMMREISLSDDELHEFEINLLTRTAELLNLNVDE